LKYVKSIPASAAMFDHTGTIAGAFATPDAFVGEFVFVTAVELAFRGESAGTVVAGFAAGGAGGSIVQPTKPHAIAQPRNAGIAGRRRVCRANHVRPMTAQPAKQ
jgi:hypothetical protein